MHQWRLSAAKNKQIKEKNPTVLQKIKSQAALSLTLNARNQGHCGLHEIIHYNFRAVMDCCWISSPGLSVLVQLKSQNPFCVALALD